MLMPLSRTDEPELKDHSPYKQNSDSKRSPTPKQLSKVVFLTSYKALPERSAGIFFSITLHFQFLKLLID